MEIEWDEEYKKYKEMPPVGCYQLNFFKEYLGILRNKFIKLKEELESDPEKTCYNKDSFL